MQDEVDEQFDTEFGMLSAKAVGSLFGLSASFAKKLVAYGYLPPPLLIAGKPFWMKKDFREMTIKLQERRGPNAPWADTIAKTKIPYRGPLPKELELFKAEFMEEYHGPAIYFLMLNSEVVYVGVSIKPMSRIDTHKLDKRFDSTLILPTPLGELFERELVFIALLNPPLNIAGKQGRYGTPGTSGRPDRQEGDRQEAAHEHQNG